MINSDNYFSKENRAKYMSCSLFKSYAGSRHKTACEAAAFAFSSGQAVRQKTDALIQGSYVDSYFEGTLDAFKKENPEIFTKSGDLYKKYDDLNNLIKFAESDDLFMKYMSGETQIVMTAKMFGVDWSIKIDSYLSRLGIVDLKVMASISSKNWSEKESMYVNFIDYFGYDIQGAIYQKVVEINTGLKLPFYIAALTKEKVPNKAIIQVDQDDLDDALFFVHQNIDRVMFLKDGNGSPIRCESCDYCKSTKKLNEVISNRDLIF